MLDPDHQLDALFGVVNIPNVIWIDEQGLIVRPAEPGWAGPAVYPEFIQQRLAERARQVAEDAAKTGVEPVNFAELLSSGQQRDSYPEAIRDWARKGAASEYALSPDDVVAASQPRSKDESFGAAHFELANHLWRAGQREAAVRHFNECHRLQPDNWTYKRQAWSLVGREKVEGPAGLFTQAPLPGEEADWPFASTFDRDLAKLGPGQYYPKTL